MKCSAEAKESRPFILSVHSSRWFHWLVLPIRVKEYWSVWNTPFITLLHHTKHIPEETFCDWLIHFSLYQPIGTYLKRHIIYICVFISSCTFSIDWIILKEDEAFKRELTVLMLCNIQSSGYSSSDVGVFTKANLCGWNTQVFTARNKTKLQKCR